MFLTCTISYGKCIPRKSKHTWDFFHMHIKKAKQNQNFEAPNHPLQIEMCSASKRPNKKKKHQTTFCKDTYSMQPSISLITKSHSTSYP